MYLYYMEENEFFLRVSVLFSLILGVYFVYAVLTRVQTLLVGDADFDKVRFKISDLKMC